MRSAAAEEKVGRATAASGGGKSDRAASARVSIRRSALESRREFEGADAMSDRAAALAAERDDAVRQARSGRGDELGY